MPTWCSRPLCVMVVHYSGKVPIFRCLIFSVEWFLIVLDRSETDSKYEPL